MTRTRKETALCDICGKSFPATELVVGELVRQSVAREIIAEHPDWSPTQHICRNDLDRYRALHIESLLSSEKGEMSALDEEVLESMRNHDIVAADVDREFEHQWTLGERLADHIAEFGGSWAFLISFSIFIVIWIIINSVALFMKPADPYPYILLNLMLSCLAAIQAPVIMMSQNRQEAKDRLRARNDYQVNLKAELEIRHLHEKMDHLLSNQWTRLVEIQQVQFDLLDELRRSR